MATQVDEATILAAWDAAIAAYDIIRGSSGVNDIMGSGVDLRSTASGGQWGLADADFPDYNPNSNMNFAMEHAVTGDRISGINYDTMLFGPTMLRFAPIIDNYLGAIYKYWLIETTALAILLAAPGVPTDIEDWSGYKTLVDALAGVHEWGGNPSMDNEWEEDNIWPHDVEEEEIL